MTKSLKHKLHRAVESNGAMALLGTILIGVISWLSLSVIGHDIVLATLSTKMDNQANAIDGVQNTLDLIAPRLGVVPPKVTRNHATSTDL